MGAVAITKENQANFVPKEHNAHDHKQNTNYVLRATMSSNTWVGFNIV